MSCVLWPPNFGKGYHLFLENFYSTLTLLKHFYDRAVIATGTILLSRRGFPPALSMCWVRDPPCLVLQWVDKIVSTITNVGNANEQDQVTWRVRTDGVCRELLVKQPKIFKTNMKMNAVDRSH